MQVLYFFNAVAAPSNVDAERSAVQVKAGTETGTEGELVKGQKFRRNAKSTNLQNDNVPAPRLAQACRSI